MARIVPPLVLKMVEDASRSAKSDVSPFWLSGSEGVAEEGMYLLAFDLDVENPDGLLNQLPPGYRMVYAIFLWETSRAGEGFGTGTDNSGPALVHAAARAYADAGMKQEAAALERMLAQYSATPQDSQRIEAAYDAADNPYREDWDRIPRLVRHLCENADRYFYVES